MDLITGGTGFIGSYLARTLLQQGRDVATLDIKAVSPMLRPFEGKWRHFQGNLGNLSEVLTAVSESKPETIYHLGGMLSMPSEQNPQASFQTNMVGTYNLLEAAQTVRGAPGHLLQHERDIRAGPAGSGRHHRHHAPAPFHHLRGRQTLRRTHRTVLHAKVWSRFSFHQAAGRGRSRGQNEKRFHL